MHTLMRFVCCLAVFAATSARADSAMTSASFEGRWELAERRTTIAITKSQDGAWQGRIVASARQEELGQWALRDVKRDPDTGQWRGDLVTSDAGDAKIVMALRGPNTLEMVAKKLVFSKTLVWQRK